MDVLKLKYIVPCRYVITVDDGDDTGVGIVACDVGVEVVVGEFVAVVANGPWNACFF